MRGSGLEHRLQPTRAALALLKLIHQLASARLELRGHARQRRVVAVRIAREGSLERRALLRRPSLASPVELVHGGDEERGGADEVVELEPAPALEQDGVRALPVGAVGEARDVHHPRRRADVVQPLADVRDVVRVREELGG